MIDVVLSGIFKSIGLYKEYSDEHTKEAEKLLNLVGMLSYKDQYLGYLSTGQNKSNDCSYINLMYLFLMNQHQD